MSSLISNYIWCLNLFIKKYPIDICITNQNGNVGDVFEHIHGSISMKNMSLEIDNKITINIGLGRYCMYIFGGIDT